MVKFPKLNPHVHVHQVPHIWKILDFRFCSHFLNSGNFLKTFTVVEMLTQEPVKMEWRHRHPTPYGTTTSTMLFLCLKNYRNWPVFFILAKNLIVNGWWNFYWSVQLLLQQGYTLVDNSAYTKLEIWRYIHCKADCNAVWWSHPVFCCGRQASGSVGDSL